MVRALFFGGSYQMANALYMQDREDKEEVEVGLLGASLLGHGSRNSMPAAPREHKAGQIWPWKWHCAEKILFNAQKEDS